MVPSTFTRKFLILFAFVVCVFYLAYRAIFTFNDTGPYALTASIALYVAECFGIFNLFLFFLQVWDVTEPPVLPVLEGRSVDVFIPTFNEEPSLLRATLEACVRMDYPHKTFVLDDGRRPEVEALARELGVNYIARPDNRHFKAGNLNYAFERTDGEFVIVLDADHVPEPHFITRLIGYFRDDRLGYVQTPHAFYNFDSFQARLDHKNRRYWEEGHTFYYVIQPGRNYWGCPIFAGSAAMFRRTAIRDVGLMATETITEDLHTGLRMNAKGWRSMAINERLVAGQAAPDITTFHAQRMRWGTGNLSIMKYDNPLFIRGLTLPQRLCYLGSMLHWAGGIFKLIIYLTPIAMLFSGIPPVKEFTPELIGVTLIYLIVSLTTMKVVSNGYGSIINSELFSMVNFWTQIKSTFRAIFGFGSRTFNVTPKGQAAQALRKKKGVWPFIRPQTYLIILSVLALFWGWSRPALGISDDLFKPVVPSIWVLIHFWLAYKVTQRAFWPADRRVQTRHTVNVPVEYDTMAGTGAPRYGVTVDLNDTGMALVAYERFAPQDVLRLIIRGAGEVIKCKGEVRTITDLTRGQVADGFRYGIQFLNLSPLQVDALSRICLHYGVPRMYSEFDQKRGGFLGGLQKKLDRGMAQRRSEFRNPYRLPIVINSGTSEDMAQFSATEDLSRSAVAAMLENELPKNTQVGYLMASPLGEVRGFARVIRTIPQVFGGKTYHRTVLEFSEFEGQSRTTLHSLVNPEEAGPLREVLKPTTKPIVVQMAGATLVAVLIAVPLILLQSGLFNYYHKDDVVLRDINNKKKRGEPLTAQDAASVERIFEATMKDKNPTSDRLVLLMTSLGVYDRKNDQLRVAEELAGRNTGDLTLQQTLIYAQMRAEKYADAELTFERLTSNKKLADKFGYEEQRQLELSGARVAEGRGDLPEALRRYKELFDKNPGYIPRNEKDSGGVTIRREYAGVLLKAGSQNSAHYDEAKKVLQDTPPEDVESKKMLAAAYLLKGRSFVADATIPDAAQDTRAQREYEGAEQVAASLASYAERKDDKGLAVMANKMKADVEMARKSWANAKAILAKMVEPFQGDTSRVDSDLLRRMAQVQLGNREYGDAMNGFAVLLDNDRVSDDNKTQVIHGFLDAAGEKSLTLGARETKIANKIYDNDLGLLAKNPVYLARLGWVLQRVSERKKSQIVLEQAVAQNVAQGSKDLKVREQLANILIESENLEEAARVLADSNLFLSRRTLAGVHMKKIDTKEAEEELRDMLQKFPVNTKNSDGTSVTPEQYRQLESMLGTTLTLKALRRQGPNLAFDEAIVWYQNLDRKYPNDREIPALLGHVFLWTAERQPTRTEKQEAYASAVKQFQRVLTSKNWVPEPKPGEPKNLATRNNVEIGFIEGAAGSSLLDPAQVALARELASRRLSGIAPPAHEASQMGMILIQSNDDDAKKEGFDLLKRAAEANPTVESERRELAGAFAAAKDFESAANLLATLPRDKEKPFELVELYSGARKFESARRELATIAADEGAKPADKKRAARELVKITAYASGAGSHAEALKLVEEFVKKDQDDLEMRVFQAEVNIWDKNLDKALELFIPLVKQNPENSTIAAGFANVAAKVKTPLTEEVQGLLVKVADRAAAPDNKDALLVARAAEAFAAKLNDPIRGRQLALKAATMDPKDPIVRREIAFVLAHPSIQLFKEADAMFTGMELKGDDRMQYVFIASSAENYTAARKQARLYAQENKGDPKKYREARKLLADVLTWKGDYEEALAIYNQLTEGKLEDQNELREKIAEVFRYSQNYPMALQKVGELLSSNCENKKLWIGFIDAASSAPKIENQKELLLKLHTRMGPEITDPRTLSRLAWIMLRIKEPARAHPLLTRAVAANPDQPATRKELAGVLAAADRRLEAIDMLTVPSVLANLDVTEMLNLADLLTAESQLERAEAELAKVVTEVSDRKSRIRYASILLWNAKYAKSKEVLQRLLKDFPQDREVMLLLAQSYLWSQDYRTALARFTDMVVSGPDPMTKQDPLANPDIWRGFIDAASGAVGEELRAFPQRNIGPLFSPSQRQAIIRAFDFLSTVRDKTASTNKEEMEKLLAAGDDKDPSFDGRKRVLQAKNDNRLKTLAGSMGRLGLLLGLLGERERSNSAFGAALQLDRLNRDVWLQYAQTLTALGEDQRAKPVYDWLLSNPEKKLPPPSELTPK